MDFIKFFFRNNEAHLKQTKLATDLESCVFENLLFNEKMKKIERFFDKSNNIVLKIFFWERYNNFQQYLLNFEIEDVELIKNYKGKNLPGIVIIHFDHYNKVFFHNLLLCHFNSDFSINPKLNIHPHFLIKHSNSITILDIYDDRGMYVLSLRST